MMLSVWEYLRERTRDAVLAGFQDALDIVEGDDTNGSQHDQAKKLLSRFRGTAAVAVGSLIELSVPTSEQAQASVENNPSKTKPSEAKLTEAPQRPADASTFDDELQGRFDAAAAQNGSQTPPAQTKSARKRRGRPRKQEQAKP